MHSIEAYARRDYQKQRPSFRPRKDSKHRRIIRATIGHDKEDANREWRPSKCVQDERRRNGVGLGNHTRARKICNQVERWHTKEKQKGS